MHDDDLRDLLTRYAAAPGEPAPSASTLRARAGRRRAAAVGVGSVVTVAGIAAAAVLLPPTLRGPAPYATPAPSATTAPADASSALSCAAVADAWTTALTTAVRLPDSLGANPRLAPSPPSGGLVAMGLVGERYVPAVFPAGFDGPMVRLLPGAGERVAVVAVAGNRAVFRVAEGPDDASARVRLVVMDGPDATPRTLVAATPPESLTWTDTRIVGDRLRWFEMPFPTGVPIRLSALELPLDGSATEPTRVDLGLTHAAWPLLVTDSRVLVHRPDGSWAGYAAADLTPVTLPPVPTAFGATRLSVGSPVGDRVPYVVDPHRPESAAWEFDVVTGANRELMRGVRWASAYGELVIGRVDTDETRTV